MSNEKSLSLALEVAKKARSKKSFGADEVRKARLHNMLFGLGDADVGDDDLLVTEEPIQELEAPQENQTPSRKERLAKLLATNSPVLGKKEPK